MEIDIQYLLFLQNLRLMTGGIFDEVFNSISKFAVDYMIMIPYIVYWSVDKSWGYRYMFTTWISECVNGVIKLTVCAYRPWIRSPLIEPAGDSKVAATGYSFPSGHTLMATLQYGTTIVYQKDKRKWLAIICGIMIALTGFSRNFLGVHTPQDVIVGFLEALAVIIAVGKASDYLKGKEELIDKLTYLGIFSSVVFAAYAIFKNYPTDYVNGILLVDPVEMQKDLFCGCGGFLALLMGSYIERHFIHYEINFNSKNLPVLTAVGVLLMMAWRSLFYPAILVRAFGIRWGNYLGSFVLIFFAVVIWPMVIRKFNDNNK